MIARAVWARETRASNLRSTILQTVSMISSAFFLVSLASLTLGQPPLTPPFITTTYFKRGPHARANFFKNGLLLEPGCDRAKMNGSNGCFCYYYKCGWTAESTPFPPVGIKCHLTDGSGIPMRTVTCTLGIHFSLSVFGLKVIYNMGDILTYPRDGYPTFPLDKFKKNDFSGYYELVFRHTYAFGGKYFPTFGLLNVTSGWWPYVAAIKLLIPDELDPATVCRPTIRTLGIGPCGRPVVVDVNRPHSFPVSSWVHGTGCRGTVAPTTDIQFLVMLPRGALLEPNVVCFGSVLSSTVCPSPPQPCSIAGTLEIPASCMRPDVVLKVMIRQIWHRNGYPVEVFQAGFIRPVVGPLYAAIVGGPTVYLTDNQRLFLDGTPSGSLHGPTPKLEFDWVCIGCNMGHAIYKEFSARNRRARTVELNEERIYTDHDETFKFSLTVRAGKFISASQNISVHVPSERDRRVVWTCPCCEYGIFTIEELILEVRPWRSETFKRRLPYIYRTVTFQNQRTLVPLTEQKGAVLVLPSMVGFPGWTRFTATLLEETSDFSVFMFDTKRAFEKHHLFNIPNKPPIVGRCAVVPPRGVAVRNPFTFECKGFADPEGGPLLYEFYFCFHHPNQLTSPAGQGIDPRRECNLMKSARNQHVFQSVLPLGNLKQSATVSMMIFITDNVGQFIRAVVPVDLEPLTCSSFRLMPVDQYAHTAAGASQVITYMRTTSKMMNSKFFDSCNTGPTLQKEEEQRRGYLDYLRKTDTRTEGDLRTQAEAFRDIVLQNRANPSRTFKDEAVTLLSSYAQKFNELTNANDSDRVPEKTAVLGQVLISGMKTMLNLTAPTDVAKPGAVSKMEDTCTSAETIVANMAHVAEGVTRVVDTIDADREMRVDDYEIWIRDSKRQGYLGSENGTKVRINGAVNQLTTIVFPSNPFNCDNSSRFSNTQAVLVDVKNGTDGSSKFSRLGVNIVLKRPEALVFEDINDTFHTSFANVSIHTIVVTQPGVYVKIEVAPVNDEDRFITAVTMNRLPTSQDFLKQNLRNLLFNVPKEVRFVSVPDRGTLTLAVYPLTNETKRKLQDRLYKSSEDFINVSYILRSATYSCLLWNSTRQTWATSGCRVLHFSDNQYVRCACDHASVFTGGLFIAPHPIDFTNLQFLFQGMSSNLVMTIVVAVVWVLYGVVMVWSFQQDARDEGAAGIEYLSENNPNDAFGYLLSFYTWFRSGAGTSSKVSIKIHGSQEDSRTVVIRDGGKNPFALQAGGRDWYFLSHPTSLGTVETIDITVDQKGKNPPWTLNTIVIRDLQTSSRTIFLIDQKLRPDSETGTSTFTFEPTSASVLRSPLRIFKARVIRYFREEHLIFSIFSRLPTGSFTRKQRASVALLLVVSGMVVCLMFYGLNGDEDEIFRSDILYTLVEVPPLSEVIIAMQSSAIVTPFVFLVLFLFERSRPPFLHRKSIVPKVAVDGSVQEWLDDDAKSASSSPTGKVPKELLTNSATNYIFPKWASFTAWVLCIGGSIIISIFIILYGLTYGYYRSLSWLRCNMFNVIVTEFIVHPVKLIVMSAVMAGIFRTPLEMENIPLRFIE